MAESGEQSNANLGRRATDKPAKSSIPQFAIDAADRQLGKASGVLTDAADTIDELFDGKDLPLGDSIQKLAGSASEKLRSLGDSTNAQDAGELVADVQRRAAQRPALSIAAGAAIGAVLAFAFVRSAPADKSSPIKTGNKAQTEAGKRTTAPASEGDAG